MSRIRFVCCELLFTTQLSSRALRITNKASSYHVNHFSMEYFAGLASWRGPQGARHQSHGGGGQETHNLHLHGKLVVKTDFTFLSLSFMVIFTTITVLLFIHLLTKLILRRKAQTPGSLSRHSFPCYKTSPANPSGTPSMTLLR